jgi:hypothetical protein
MKNRNVAIPIVPVVTEPAIAFVAKHSPGAGDPHDRGVAKAIACRLAHRRANAIVGETRGIRA